MSFLNRIMSTQLPGAMLFPRLFVGTVLVVDSIRGWGLCPQLGASAIESLDLSSVILVKVLCAIQAICGILIAAGYLTRLATLPVMALWTVEAFTAWSRVGTFGTARAIDETLLAIGVIAVGLMLLIRGAGIWSLDASLSRPAR